ncbi:hypothetical protein HG543_53370, partial [Pyxidicoccus fallax]|nr:hypothetical protein [Pyxidicoccus fallax]
WETGETAPLEPRGVSFEVSHGPLQGRVVLREQPSRVGVEMQLTLLRRGAVP